MTQSQFNEKISHLLNHDKGIRSVIYRACKNAMASDYAKSKFVNPAEDNFILPKTVLSAVLSELAWQYEPFNKQDKKQVKQIKPHVKFTR